MKIKSFRWSTWVFFFSYPFLVCASPVFYTVTDLGPIDHPEHVLPYAQAFGLNENGTVVGATTTDRTFSAAYVFDRAAVQLLPTLGAFPGLARGINSREEIVGYSSVGGGPRAGTVRRPVVMRCVLGDRPVSECGAHVSVRDIGYFPGTPDAHRESIYGEATGINSEGKIVGFEVGWVWATPRFRARTGLDYMLAERAFLYSADRGIIDLGVFFGSTGVASAAWAINERTEVVGHAETSDRVSHAFIWDGKVMHDLDTLDGPMSFGYGVNNGSFVVGLSNPTWRYDFYHAFVAVPSGRGHRRTWAMRDLGSLLGADFQSGAFGINDEKRIVGWSEAEMRDREGTPRVERHATAWHESDVFDLNDFIITRLDWVLQDALAINQRGQIVGSGRVGGETHGFRLDPI